MKVLLDKARWVLASFTLSIRVFPFTLQLFESHYMLVLGEAFSFLSCRSLLASHLLPLSSSSLQLNIQQVDFSGSCLYAAALFAIDTTPRMILSQGISHISQWFRLYGLHLHASPCLSLRRSLSHFCIPCILRLSDLTIKAFIYSHPIHPLRAIWVTL